LEGLLAMGLSLEFYTGDMEAITAAVTALDFDLLDESDIVTGYADLSLHIVPEDLDTLSQVMGSASGMELRDLRPHLTVVLDEEDHGALSVDPSWVAYVAAVPEEQIPDVANRWAQAMATKYQDDEIQMTEELLESVTNLVILCKTAMQQGQPVLHVWYK
jgi:hypothetical protein